MHEVRTVAVIGLGYVGLPTAALLARAGFEVQGVDRDPEIIAELEAGECRLAEREVTTIVRDAIESGRLSLSVRATRADAFIICVPTPITAENSADMTMVAAAIKAAAPAIDKGALVILESTSPIGATRAVIASALSARGLDPETDVDIAYCPERVFPGATVREILRNDRVIGGLTERAASRAKLFYRSFCEGGIVTATAEAAEFAKLMENTFRDVNIALANAFARIAEDAGVDVMEVISAANRHPRVNVLSPGPGVGGHCIPVDPWFLIDRFPEAGSLMRMSRKINDGQAERLLGRLEEAGLKKGSVVAILGAAYRGNLDDARESPTGRLLSALCERGYAWRIHDPHVQRMTGPGGLDASISDDLSATLDGVDAAIIMTDHSAYRMLSPDKFEGVTGRLIADGRRVLHVQAFVEAGFTIAPLGAPIARPRP